MRILWGLCYGRGIFYDNQDDGRGSRVQCRRYYNYDWFDRIRREYFKKWLPCIKYSVTQSHKIVNYWDTWRWLGEDTHEEDVSVGQCAKERREEKWPSGTIYLFYLLYCQHIYDIFLLWVATGYYGPQADMLEDSQESPGCLVWLHWMWMRRRSRRWRRVVFNKTVIMLPKWMRSLCLSCPSSLCPVRTLWRRWVSGHSTGRLFLQQE